MAFIEIIFIAVGLSADAFSVSIGNGMCMPEETPRASRPGVKNALIVAAAFGVFQALMPFIGWVMGGTFAGHIDAYDHIVALALLAFIGGKMVFEGVKSMRKGQTERSVRELRFGPLLVQAIATSIDALIVGVGFATVGLALSEILKGAGMIGIITFALSFLGVLIGKRVGALLGPRAEIIGGLILIAIGVKIFIEG
jgi:putative Mn2+ efflux pump MntP